MNGTWGGPPKKGKLKKYQKKVRRNIAKLRNPTQNFGSTNGQMRMPPGMGQQQPLQKQIVDFDNQTIEDQARYGNGPNKHKHRRKGKRKGKKRERKNRTITKVPPDDLTDEENYYARNGRLENYGKKVFRGIGGALGN